MEDDIQLVGPRIDIQMTLATGAQGQPVVMVGGMLTSDAQTRAISAEEAMAYMCRAIGMHLDSLKPAPSPVIQIARSGMG